MFNLFAEAEGEVRCCRPFFLENMQILAWYFRLVKHNFPLCAGFFAGRAAALPEMTSPELRGGRVLPLPCQGNVHKAWQ